MFMEDAPFSYIGRWSGVEPACTTKDHWFFTSNKGHIYVHLFDCFWTNGLLGIDNELCFVTFLVCLFEDKWPQHKHLKAESDFKPFQ